MVCVSVCGQDKCTERPKTNSDVFPQTLPSFRDSISLWILVLTVSIALLPTKPQGPSCLHPTQARELQAQSTRSPFLHGWQESCDLGVPQAFHWDVIQGSLTAETSCVFQRDADCREDPHPTPVVLCMNPHIHTFLWGQFRLNTSWKASWVRLQRRPSCSSSQPQHLARTSCLCLVTLAYRFWF